eukprot:CAMPEP_0171711734 /NCGR_PEP_ID=MMETSP0991-20121206/16752_1 /TAXON_ID=483369 /ORGANISM="non described non described, Strain CCMP2098" /LENGTH=64 /DNA_ID=CAMNT_0012302093 /DNA_START=1454 /DNA_END=1649 /DNA_ORIENTATION=+
MTCFPPALLAPEIVAMKEEWGANCDEIQFRGFGEITWKSQHFEAGVSGAQIIGLLGGRSGRVGG